MTTPDEVAFPLKEFLGFTVERGEGKGWTRVDLSDQHQNPNGVAHGAVPFALMDTAMGSAVMSVIDEGQLCATIEMHTRFHRPASEGTLTAEAEVMTGGKRVIQLRAETRDGNDRLIASATASFAVIKPPG